MSTFLAFTPFETTGIVFNSNLTSASGALQTQISASGGGGGGGTLAPDILYTSGVQTISGVKIFSLSIPSTISQFGTNISTTFTGSSVLSAGATAGGIKSVLIYSNTSSLTSLRGPMGIYSSLQDVALFSGLISNHSAFYSDGSLQGSGTIANHRHIWLRNIITGSSIISNSFGLYIENPTASTQNYSIFSEGGANVFSGSLGIGQVGTGADPRVSLHVGGGIRIDGLTTTSATLGGASTLPLTPLGYLTVNVTGINVKIPYYS